MKRLIFFSLVLVLVVPMTAFASLDSFLSSLNVQARADMSGFSAKVSAQFGVPTAKVQMVLQSVPEPADAFMLFQLGQYSGKPVDQVYQVYQVYQPNKKKGWGAIAKELGIKPGSPEFHALKRGDLRLTGQPMGHGGQEDAGPGKGKGKGHGKGHNK